MAYLVITLFLSFLPVWANASEQQPSAIYVKLSRRSGSSSYYQGPAEPFLTAVRQKLNEIHRDTQNSPHGKAFLELIKKDDVTDDAIYTYLAGLTTDEITSLQPLKDDVSKRFHPTVRTRIRQVITKNAGNSPKWDAMTDLFTNKLFYFRSSNPDSCPSGYYRTDQGFIVRIDHDLPVVGQQTEHGSVTRINPHEE